MPVDVLVDDVFVPVEVMDDKLVLVAVPVVVELVLAMGAAGVVDTVVLVAVPVVARTF